MDTASIAASLTAAKAQQTQISIGARLMQMNQQSDAAITDLLQSAAETTQSVVDSAKALTTGAALDIKV